MLGKNVFGIQLVMMMMRAKHISPTISHTPAAQKQGVTILNVMATTITGVKNCFVLLSHLKS